MTNERNERFREVTDALAGMSHGQIAALLGVEYQHYKQMRLPPENAGHRPPPRDWSRKLADALERHGSDLKTLSAQLRSDHLEGHS